MSFRLLLQPRVVGPATPPPPEGTPTESAPPAAWAAELTQPLCEAANRTQWITAGAYDVGALLVALAVFTWLKRQLWGTRTVRYVVAIALSAVTGAVLLAMDPLRADDIVRCVHTPEFARFITFGSALAARVIVLGVVPSVVLAALGCALINRSY